MAQTVAVLNSNEDIIEMLRVVLEQAGFNTAAGHVPTIKRGQQDFLAFVEQHDPAAIVYDIAPPYLENWNFLKLVLNLDAMKNRKVVLTTANEKLLREVTGNEVSLFELSEKPYTLEAIVDAVKRSLQV